MVLNIFVLDIPTVLHEGFQFFKLIGYSPKIMGQGSEVLFVGVPDHEKSYAVLKKMVEEKRLSIRIGIRAGLESWTRLPCYDPCVAFYDLWAFDFHRPKEGSRTAFHTVLCDPFGPSIEGAVIHFSSLGILLNKMNLGLTAAGRKYCRVPPGAEGNGYGEKCCGPQLEHSEMEPHAIEEYLNKNSAAKVFHTAIGGVIQSFIYNAENGDWISFDDPQTLEGKAQWACDLGLHGSFLVDKKQSIDFNFS